MANVTIRCPATSKPVFTGMRIDEAAFAAITMPRITLGSCPQCGRTHKWSKIDAWLEEDASTTGATRGHGSSRTTPRAGSRARAMSVVGDGPADR